MVEVVLALAALAVAVWVLAAPLRSGRAAVDRDEARIADLEAAKEAKYREIREAELDFRTGKLAEADWKAMDRELRAEAVELLRELDGYHR